MFGLRKEIYRRSGALIGAINRDYQNAVQEGFSEDSKVARRIKEDLDSVKNILDLLDDTSCPVFFAPIFNSTFRNLEREYVFRKSCAGFAITGK